MYNILQPLMEKPETRSSSQSEAQILEKPGGPPFNKKNPYICRILIKYPVTCQFLLICICL